eukprot:3206275-Rhodomonas_salina.2
MRGAVALCETEGLGGLSCRKERRETRKGELEVGNEHSETKQQTAHTPCPLQTVQGVCCLSRLPSGRQACTSSLEIETRVLAGTGLDDTRAQGQGHLLYQWPGQHTWLLAGGVIDEPETHSSNDLCPQTRVHMRSATHLSSQSALGVRRCRPRWGSRHLNKRDRLRAYDCWTLQLCLRPQLAR